jgi:PilZ domain
MKKRPLALLLFSLIMISSALSFPFQICIVEDISFLNFSEWLNRITLLNWLSMASLVSVAGLAYYASTHLLIAIPINSIILTVNNFWVGYVGLNFSLAQTSIASAGLFLTTCLLLEKKTFAVLRNQKLRWWRTAERKKVHLPVSLHPWVGETIMATTFDVSESGAFIATTPSAAKLNVGDKMQLRLSLAGHLDIRCTARLVRKADAAGAYPQGMGVIFEDLSGSERQFLRQALHA